MAEEDPDQVPMDERDDESRGTSMRDVMKGSLPLETETTWYLLFSVLDVLLTYLLLTRGKEGGMRFYESNPLARYVLNHWGLKGIIVYKFVLVAIVCVIAQLVATRRMPLARGLLWFATAAVGGVVLYSAYLMTLAIGG